MTGLRTAEPADLDTLVRHRVLAFHVGPDQARDHVLHNGLEHCRVYEEHGAAVASLLVVPMGQRWGGRSVPCHGIAGVAVPPEHRGRGVATRMMRAWLTEAAAAGVATSALYDASQPLYQQVGYGRAGAHVEHTVPVRVLAGTRDLPVIALDERADGPLMASLYAEQALEHDGWLDRGPYVWHRVFHRHQRPHHAFGVCEGGRVTGYVVYRHTDDNRLALTDLVATTPASNARLLGFLAAHGSILSHVLRWSGPMDPVLGGLEVNAIQSKVELWWMLRLVDLPAAMAHRGFRAEGAADLYIDDADLPSMAGPWRLVVEGGRGRAERGGEGTVRLSAAAAATVYSGLVSPMVLAGRGAAEGPPEALRALGRLFAGPGGSLPDHF